MLTKRQKQILDFIASFQKRKGFAPSLEEIKKHLKLSSVSTIHFHIKKLQDSDYLRKKENSPRSISVHEDQQMVKIPLMGVIAAGQPIEAIETYETISVPKNLLAKSGEHFALQVKGSSMIQEGIFDGDNVIIRKQNHAENGETIVALINGNEVTLKKMYRIAGGFKLQPANPTMPVIKVKQLIVQGKVVSVIRSYETKKGLNQTLNLFVFNEELKQLLSETQKEIKNKFNPNQKFENWQKAEDSPNSEKFCLETSYAFFNEIILFWVCRDKKILKFETIQSKQQLALLKIKAKQIYEHIFTNAFFDWYEPSDFLLQKITNTFNKYDFSQIDRDILGKLYEQFITREERKKLGQFYTPEPIIDYILDQTGYTDNIEDKKIIDISCGSGGFITRAAKRLINKLNANRNSKKEIIGKVVNNIYGLDINPFACYLAETNLLIQLLDLIIEVKIENPGYKIPKLKIFQTNTMESPTLLSAEEKEIKDIKNKTGKFAKGFDFVVGNPPYLEAKKMCKKTKELCSQTCPRIASGAFDLFICFIDKGLRLLKDNGKFGYIIPNKFLIANYAQKMRENILNIYSIKEIIDVSECEVFENVSVYPIIMIIDNKKPKNNIIKTAEKINHTKELENKTFAAGKIAQDAYKRDSLVFFILPSDKLKNQLLIKLLGKEYKTLDNYLTIKWTISFHASGLRENFYSLKNPPAQQTLKS